MTNPDGDTLYQRLGGRDLLERTVRRWVERMGRDPEIGLFHEFDEQDMLDLTSAVVDCMSAASRELEHVCVNRDDRRHPLKLIMVDHWESSATHLVYVLATEGVPDKLQGELISCLAGLRDAI